MAAMIAVRTLKQGFEITAEFHKDPYVGLF
jgi:hypothetical protein